MVLNTDGLFLASPPPPPIFLPTFICLHTSPVVRLSDRPCDCPCLLVTSLAAHFPCSLTVSATPSSVSAGSSPVKCRVHPLLLHKTPTSISFSMAWRKKRLGTNVWFGRTSRVCVQAHCFLVSECYPAALSKRCSPRKVSAELCAKQVFMVSHVSSGNLGGGSNCDFTHLTFILEYFRRWEGRPISLP